MVIFTMVSSPDFDRNDVASYLNSTNNELMNKLQRLIVWALFLKLSWLLRLWRWGQIITTVLIVQGYYDVWVICGFYAILTREAGTG